ncbi:MAG: 3-hydroxybutyrate dehydrogenase [Oleiphilaceae bacterium]|jgi:3-hydroxybutyrate dehydrogenase
MHVTNNYSAKRVAVVTGGANGIGAAISKTLVVQDYQVMIADRDADTGKAFADSINATFFQVDLSEKSACKELIEATVDQLGSVDILVNNAGFQHISPLVEFPEDVWNNMMNVMLNAPFLLTKYAWPHMQKNQWGRIINMASIHSLVASANKSAYITAKHGLIGLTKAAALEGGADGITVNAISPAYVRSALVEKQLAAQAKANNISEGEVLEQILLKNSSVKRLIEPQEVADLVLMLCSENSKSITGSNLTIDGGWTAQ